MRILIESYYYLFYRLWKWHRKHFGESDKPHLNATLNLGLLALINWMTFLLGFRVLFGFELVSFSKTAGTITVVAIGAVMFLIFFRSQRYKKIIEKFDSEGAKEEKLRGLLSTLYPIVTILLLILAWFFAWGINNR